MLSDTDAKMLALATTDLTKAQTALIHAMGDLCAVEGTFAERALVEAASRIVAMILDRVHIRRQSP